VNVAPYIDLVVPVFNPTAQIQHALLPVPIDLVFILTADQLHAEHVILSA